MKLYPKQNLKKKKNGGKSDKSLLFCFVFGLDELLDLIHQLCLRVSDNTNITTHHQQQSTEMPIRDDLISVYQQCKSMQPKNKIIFWSSLFLNFWPRANIFFLFVLWLHNVPVMGLGFVKDGQSTVDGRAVRESHKRESQRKKKQKIIIQWLVVSFFLCVCVSSFTIPQAFVNNKC